MQSYIATVWATSAIVGPALGAIIVANLDWRWVFWINLPLGLVALVMLRAFYRETIERRRHRIDYLGAGLLMLSSGTLMLALIQAATYSTNVLVGLATIAAICVAALWRVERRAAEPILPPSLWQIPVVTTATVGTIVVGALAMGVVTYLPVHIQGVLGHTADVVAIGLAAMAISWSFCAGLGGRLSIRTTYRLVIMSGSVVLIAGAAFLVFVSSSTNVSVIIAGSVIIGMGLGFTSSTYVVAVQTNVNWQIRGSATSTIHFARMFGQALGAAFFGMVINLNLRADGTSISNVDTLMDPVRREQLDASLRDPLIAALGGALTDVYVITCIIAVLALAVAAFMPRGLNPGTSLGSQSPG